MGGMATKNERPQQARGRSMAYCYQDVKIFAEPSMTLTAGAQEERSSWLRATRMSRKENKDVLCSRRVIMTYGPLFGRYPRQKSWYLQGIVSFPNRKNT